MRVFYINNKGQLKFKEFVDSARYIEVVSPSVTRPMNVHYDVIRLHIYDFIAENGRAIHIASSTEIEAKYIYNKEFQDMGLRASIEFPTDVRMRDKDLLEHLKQNLEHKIGQQVLKELKDKITFTIEPHRYIPQMNTITAKL